MESLVSVLGTVTMLIISLQAARRWAKSLTQALLWGAAAGMTSAYVVLVSVVVIYHLDPTAFYAPTISLRLANSLFLGPIGGALLTASLWRRDRKSPSAC